MLRYQRYMWFSLLVTVCAVWSAMGVVRPPFLEKLERHALDQRLVYTAPVPASPEIALVLAGEDTLAQFGQWPWPRRYHAQLLARLGLAKTILLDILFPETSTDMDDATLAKVVEQLGNVIVAMHMTPALDGKVDRLVPPFPKLLQASRAVGYTNIRPDIDGLVRFALPSIKKGELAVPALPLAGLAFLQGDSPEIVPISNGYRLQIGDRSLPLDEKARMWLHFRPQPFPTYEYGRVINGEVSPETFRNKIVVVGIAAAGVEDFFLVPSPSGRHEISGTQLNAEILRNMLAGKIPRRLPARTDGIITAVVGIIVIAFVTWLRPMYSMLFTVILCCAYGSASYGFVKYSMLWTTLITPVACALSIYFLATFLRLRHLYQDWQVKTFSLSSIYKLAQSSDIRFDTFEAHLKSIWPQIEKITGIRMLAVQLNAAAARAETSPALLDDCAIASDRIILSKTTQKPRFRLLIPLTGVSAPDQPEYTLLGWHKKRPDDLVQAVATIISSAAWYYSLAKENRKRKQLLFDTIRAVFTAMDFRDPITGGHSTRVSELTLQVLRELPLSEKTVEDIYLGSLIHDIGKIGIPDAILKKSDNLTDEEFKLIKSHTEIGRQIMEPVQLPQATLSAICDHHELYDGAGYPCGKEGPDISLAGRIVTVADVFDALRNDRPYRKAMSLNEVCDYLWQRAGIELDPEIVDIVLKLKAPADWVPPQKKKKHHKNNTRRCPVMGLT